MNALVHRALAVLRSPAVRWAFLVGAVALAVVAVVGSWDDVVHAAEQMKGWHLAGSAVVGVAYVWCTFLAWRAVLADLGSPLPLRPAVAVFGISQIGKYVPGGVWNVVAAAEIGADHKVPRTRSLAAMGLAVLLGAVSGVVVGVVCLPVARAEGLGGWAWLAWVAPLLLVLLVPPVLSRIVSLGFRLLRRPPLERPLTWSGLGAGVAWSVLSWVLAGVHVWLLATGLGLEATGRTLVLLVGAYAVAWVAGFVVVFVPAGAGVREAVLIALVAGSLPHAAVLLVVLIARVLLTFVDLAFAAVGMLVRPARGR